MLRPRRGHDGQFYFWGLFLTGFSARNSEGLQALKTGRRESNCVFGLEKDALAYGFGVGIGCDSVSDILGPFFEFSVVPFGSPVNVESGGCECPSEN